MNKTCAVTDSADNAGCGCVCNDRPPVLDTAAQQKLGAGQPCKSDIGSSRHRPSEKLSRDLKLFERLGVSGNCLVNSADVAAEEAGL